MMMVTLSTPLTWSEDVAPIALATATPPLGSMTLAVGYGTTRHSQDNDSPLAKTVLTPLMRCVPADPRVVCTKGIDENGRRGNTCERKSCVGGVCVLRVETTGVGDSGGPLVYQNQLIGVLSRGSEDCGLNTPDESEYAAVATNIEWIRRFVSGGGAARPSNPPVVSNPVVSSPAAGSRIHIVRDGETLDSIAAMYGVSFDALVDANRGQRFVPGLQLVIPSSRGGVAPPPSGGVVPPPSGGFVPPPSQPSLGGRTHTIRRGETFYALARLYFPGQSQATAAAAIQRANPGVTVLEVGQVVNIPASLRSLAVSAPAPRALVTGSSVRGVAPAPRNNGRRS